jgi:signal transduction histidine kinase
MPSLEPEERTEVLTGSENALQKGVEFMQSTLTGMDLCYDKNGPSIVTRVDVYREGYIAVKNRGCKIRIITEITKDNISDCKELAKLVDELRHVDGVKGGLAVNDSQYMATVATLQEGKPLTQVIYSNARAVVEQQHYIFDSMWRHAIPAEARIKEIEENTPAEITRIIFDNDEVISMYKSLIKGASQEILYLVPSARALLRIKAAGLVRLLMEAASERDVKIKILCPIEQENRDLVNQLIRQPPTTTTTAFSSSSSSINKGYDTVAASVDYVTKNSNDDDDDYKVDHNNDNKTIELRDNEPASAAILVVDGKHVLTSELRNDDAYDVYDAVSLSSYSNSRPTIKSHIALFDSLWRQKEVYDGLALKEKEIEQANEKLKAADKMKEEFINIAAHELRTPVLPIMLSAESLSEEILNGSGANADHNFKRQVEVILRNAKRLVKLTNDILDASRIESGTFKLRKDGRGIGEITRLVQEAIQDASVNMLGEGDDYDDRGIEIIFQDKSSLSLTSSSSSPSSSSTFPLPEKQELLFDRSKIIQVIANLLNNAIKFTEKGGKIVDSVDRIPGNYAGDYNGAPVSSSLSADLLEIKVADNGIGIDASVKDRIFEKFVTKSERKTGSGLGLYICKAIIEAHGGKIWAENNKDGLGATFTFTLPLVALQTTERR